VFLPGGSSSVFIIEWLTLTLTLPVFASGQIPSDGVFPQGDLLYLRESLQRVHLLHRFSLFDDHRSLLLLVHGVVASVTMLHVPGLLHFFLAIFLGGRFLLSVVAESVRDTWQSEEHAPTRHRRHLGDASLVNLLGVVI